ncbi:alpha-D-xyloside xylohydrolase [Duganella sp. 1224]|uniref:TIM-barrel domain-containing protein n=1 Tax=Duganella sp. 1224 TaxID=2587052 RepID=UPI001830CD46|nr:TIM-barrel domain-containing protein [Duganella sp. 1224]NYE63162.1 alpha-D-xyloside xylohydrolase [Duganella sp. 1224]
MVHYPRFTGVRRASLVALAIAACWSAQAAEIPQPLDALGRLQALHAPASTEFRFQRVANGVQFQLNGVTKSVIFYSPSVVRVNANLGASYWEHPSLVVIRRPQDVAFALRDQGVALELVGARLRLTIDKHSGAIAFADGDGRALTREDAATPQTITPRTISGAPTYEVENRLTLKPGEGIYGFGFTADEEVNRRNKDLLLVQTNVGIIIPVMVSSERYGVLWDTYSMMRFRDDADGARLWAESAPGGVDYYLMAGDSMDHVVGAYRWLTGDAPMYPKQAFGLFMSKERYPTQQRLLEVARTFRRERFPLDYIVQDWQYWGSDKDGSWSGMTWDRERYPDPKAMTDEIHRLHMKLMVSIWPSIGDDTALAHELDQHRLRFAPLHWISKHARVYDAYSPLGRQIYFKHIKSGLLDQGVDALWMDGTEVEVSSAMWNAMDNVRDTKALGSNAMGDFTRYLNPYSLLTTEGTYQGQRASDNKRVFTLTRSAWAGAQRTAAASWSGDIFASWKTFRQQIAGGVNVTITGNPYWTQDTGGFFVTEFPGGEHNPAYRELYARWFQYATFNPIMRVHGTSIEREPYLFKQLDPVVYQSMLNAVQLRYRLLPYIYSLSAKVTSDRYTLMRALPMDFAQDAATYDINDAFMFGPALLVHPVTRAMYHAVTPAPATIPADYLRTADGKRGLALQYFSGENFDTPRGQLVDEKIDHDWPDPPLAEIPGGLTSLQRFSARWQGELVAPEDGAYEIGLSGDDGLRLFLGDQQVIDDWKNSATRHLEVKRTLKKGERVPLKVEYYQDIGNRSVRLTWRTPSDLRALAAAANAPRDLSLKTYLPRGGDWYDFWTQQRYAGGTTVSRETPLDVVPLYVRAGAIIPMGPVQQYATEKPDAPYDVHVYPGADGRFTVYEDDNETYAYEKGQSARYELAWDDATRTLRIGARQGAFPGMVRQRSLRISVAGAGGAPRTVRYTGKAVTVRFGS